jgi:hypothetical protein
MKAKKSDWYWESKQRTLGALQAKREHESHKDRHKPIEDRAEDFLADAVKKIDPLKMVAIIGVTTVIKQGIDWTGEAIANFSVQPALFQALTVIAPVAFLAEAIPHSHLTQAKKDELQKEYDALTDEQKANDPMRGIALQKLLGMDTSQGDKEAAVKDTMNSIPVELMEWLISFTLAYLIVENFGAIVGAVGNILGVAKGLLGIKSVA